jgi:hypothetical protein
LPATTPLVPYSRRVTIWRSLPFGLAAVSLWLSACGGGGGGGGGAAQGSSVPPPGPATPEQTKVARLMNEIAEMTRSRGCEKSQECKAIGVGYTECGPRQYIVYCPRSTEEALLQEKVDELSKLEQAEAKHQSDPLPCRPLPNPEPEVFNGACRAKL